MKCFSSITILGFLILLSACSVTQQQGQPTREAAISAPADLVLEQNTATQQNIEAREAPGEQAEATPQRVPQLLSSRKRRAPRETGMQSPQQEVTAEEPAVAAAPSAAQQEAALKMMEEQAKTTESSQAEQQALVVSEEKQKERQKERQKTYQQTPEDMRSVLRVRRFSPPEESTDNDSDEPLPNSVELRGLRSPVLKSRLPMNIDGKIINNAD